jgi:hypothetical protein
MYLFDPEPGQKSAYQSINSMSARFALGLLSDHVETSSAGRTGSACVVLRLSMGDELEDSTELQRLRTVVTTRGGQVLREREADWDNKSLISSAGWRWLREKRQREKEIVVEGVEVEEGV